MVRVRVRVSAKIGVRVRGAITCCLELLPTPSTCESGAWCEGGYSAREQGESKGESDVIYNLLCFCKYTSLLQHYVSASVTHRTVPFDRRY